MEKKTGIIIAAGGGCLVLIVIGIVAAAGIGYFAFSMTQPAVDAGE